MVACSLFYVLMQYTEISTPVDHICRIMGIVARCYINVALTTNQNHWSVLHVFKLANTSMLCLFPLDSASNNIEQFHLFLLHAQVASDATF
jgi:hypothetical protein